MYYNFLFKSVFLLILIFMGITKQAGFAQTRGTELLLPASPTAYALARYGEIPVSDYTGVPSISIPIYEIKEKSINLSITLDYHASGVKVAEFGSWVGTGWSLNAGGLILRQVVGKEDFGSKYWENISQYESSQGGAAMAGHFENGDIDGAPDTYIYNFGTYSGKFALFSDGNYYSIPRNDIEISLQSYGSTARIKMVTPDGIQYIFGRSTDNVKNIYELSSSVINDQTAVDQINAFYLVEIIGLNGETVQFDYTKESYFYTAVPLQTESHIPIDGPCWEHVGSSSGFITQNIITTIQGVRLSKITWSNGSIEFIPSTLQREDMPGSYSLDKILIKNNQDIIYTSQFSYEYQNNRLFLKSLLNSADERPHIFDYRGVLPERLSTSTDHWGYYNGKPNGHFYIPSYRYAGVSYSRANKGSVESYAIRGLLAKIRYPSGGTTEFFYESNSVLLSNLSDEGLYYPSEFSLEDDNTIVETSALAQIVDGEFMEQNFELAEDAPVELILFGDDKGFFQSGCMQVVLEGVGNTRYFFYDNAHPIPTIHFQFKAGKYKIKFVRKSGADQCSFTDDYESIWITARLTWKTRNPSVPIEDQNVTVGGARISKILTIAGDGQINERRYFYHHLDNPNKSSGSIMNIPKYHFFSPKVVRGDTPCIEWVFSNSPIHPLALTSGSYVGYQNVTIIESAGGVDNGKTESIYSSYLMYPDVQYGEFPYPPTTSYDWKRGNLIERSIFSSVAGKFELISRITNRHSFKGEIETRALKFGLISRTLAGASYSVAPYSIATGFSYLAESKEETFNGDNSQNIPVVNITNFGYESKKHFQLTTRSRKNSSGHIETEYRLYPRDYNNTDGFLGKMKDNNIAFLPVEVVSLEKKDNINSVINGEYYHYSEVGLGQIDRNFKLEMDSPIPLTEFKFSNSSKGRLPFSSNGQAFYNHTDYFVESIVSKRDTYGNPIEMKALNGPMIVYLWGYGGQYPIAKIENASMQQVRSALGSSATTILNNLNAVNVSDATINQHMKTLRDKLTGARVSSFTYTPLSGMTSMTDPRGITEYYQYDGLQRLKEVLDFEKNVLINYQYHYRP